jgi:cytochrome d ubiquinol oxidase subunit II
MLLGLIMRGVAFEFRFKASSERGRRTWDRVFHLGSLAAAICQGLVLGALLSGVRVEGRDFAGGPFDWLNAFSLLTAAAVVCGYALLGATWLVMKTCGETQSWARRVGRNAVLAVGLFLALVSLATALVNETVTAFWFTTPTLWYLSPIPLMSVLLVALAARDLWLGRGELRPFLCTVGIFMLAYLGLGLSLYPWIVPYAIRVEDAAATDAALSLMLLAVLPLLPLILAYTAYSYYVFRGKTPEGQGYAH